MTTKTRTTLDNLQEFSETQGWDMASEVFLLASFIDQQGMRDAFYNFLFAEAARENEPCCICGQPMPCNYAEMDESLGLDHETGEPINA
jgi:hypothetical protein